MGRAASLLGPAVFFMLFGQAFGAGGLTGRWLGQDRHDRTGDRAKLGPNGVQDIHLAIGGVPPRLEVASVVVSGYGGDQWDFPRRGDEHAFTIVLERKPRAPVIDLFIEPNRVETGREFSVKVMVNAGSTADVNVKGGKADPNARMPDAALAARWVGQEKADHTGLGPGVGPDGFQDAAIALTRLAGREKIKSVLVEGPGGLKWAHGPNPEAHGNAELVLDPKNPTRASLFFQPDRDLAGHKLGVTVTYESGKRDVTACPAGKLDAKLAMPKLASPRVSALTLSSRWHGQESAGDVRVSVAGVAAGKPIAAAVLSDGIRGVWVFKSGDRTALDVEPDAMPLAVRKGAARNGIDLVFPPYRDETNATMTLRLVYGDGETAFGAFPGGPCDPHRRAAAPDGTESTARPGDDLGALVQRFGTVRLSKGEYALSRPLVLPKAVTLAGEPGAVLRFSQGPAEPPWTAAIKIQAGGTTLSGFAVRFVGPVRWKTDVSWGPAVIGTTDNLDNLPDVDKPNLVFENLDLMGPPASKPNGWEEAPKLMRLLRATGGRIAGNALHGGAIEFFGGPWLIERNTYNGTAANTFTHAVFAAHESHDTVVRNNRAKPAPLSGKTWRFVLFTNRGAFDRVENNVVDGIGPRDDDSIPSMNSPEIILTESYRLRFEGRPAAVSADGRLVRLPKTQGEPPRTGDVVSILTGSGAGAWRTVSQRIDPTTVLLDAALPKGADVISVAPGFVRETYEGNAIDARGGRSAAGFVLAGNHFGTRVLNNRVTGAGDAFQLFSTATEEPVAWGWSHAPFLGGRFEGNTVEDSERGAQIGVQHDGPIKSSRGRVYMTIALKGNTVRWSDAFLASRRDGASKSALAGITLGFLPAHDAGETVVEARDDRLVAPASAPSGSVLKVNAALLNGRPVTKRTFALPLPAATAAGSAADSSLRR